LFYWQERSVVILHIESNKLDKHPPVAFHNGNSEGRTTPQPLKLLIQFETTEFVADAIKASLKRNKNLG